MPPADLTVEKGLHVFLCIFMNDPTGRLMTYFNLKTLAQVHIKDYGEITHILHC